MELTATYIASKLFENKVLRLSWSAFEDFFTEIMQKYDHRFVQIKPQWSFWDRKNDGFIKEEWIYYQVYSPENPEKSWDKNGAKKALEDFAWLYSYWNDNCKIKVYNFVLNDKMKGVYPQISSTLLDLERSYPDVKFKLFLVHDLWKIFSYLNEDDVYSIVWFVPAPSNIILEYSSLSEVIGWLINWDIQYDNWNLVVPEFDKKIEFNWLTGKIKPILVNASYQLWSLENYFSHTYNKTYRGLIKTILKSYYELGKGKWLYWDNLFLYIVDESATKIKRTVATISAIYILMAYYFESCDIFEEPK